MTALSVLPERWASVFLHEPANLRATGVAEPLRRRVLQEDMRRSMGRCAPAATEFSTGQRLKIIAR